MQKTHNRDLLRSRRSAPRAKVPGRQEVPRKLQEQPNGQGHLDRAATVENDETLRDAEITIKIIFERSSPKGGRQRVRKEGQQGTHLEILLSVSSTGKTAFWKAFLLSSLFPGNTVTKILDSYRPSTLQRV